ncbi:PEGA domain-containing protein [Kribbella sp. NPDC051770]|uniref:PEGA domain-containing protein n=1 Tax=Kribbella sp. NPDC051770 TaxID=3155413 RepID=UPI0034193173
MEEKPRSLVVGGAVVLIVLVLIGGFLLFRGAPEHTVTVRSVPNDLTLTVDGSPVAANGEVKLKEGKHTLVGERSGFKSYSQTIDVRDDTSVRVYLFSNSAEGRAWEKDHPDQAREAEGDSGRRYQELTDRLEAKYPLLRELPYVGPGFDVNQGISKREPDNPEVLAFYVKLSDAEGKTKFLQWIKGLGLDINTLEIVYR